MTFQKYLLACPYCQKLVSFHRMMSCTLRSGGSDEQRYIYTDLGGSPGPHHNLPITRCPQCRRYYQRNQARKYDSLKVSESVRKAAPSITDSFLAHEIYDAIGEGAYKGPEEELTLRLYAWWYAQEPARQRVTGMRGRFSDCYFWAMSKHSAFDENDNAVVAHSIMKWYMHRVEREKLHLRYQHYDDPNISHTLPTHLVLPPCDTIDFEREIAKRQQLRSLARDRLWEIAVKEPPIHTSWHEDNLKQIINLLPGHDQAYKSRGKKSKDTETDEWNRKVLFSRNRIIKAEALRQQGRCEETLRILGSPEAFQMEFREYRHVARVIFELANKGYRFLWFSVVDEDCSSEELTAGIRDEVNRQEESYRQYVLHQAARQRDLEFVKRALLYQKELDRGGQIEGKSLEQLIVEKATCPRCHFRYLWNGESCGHCDKTVYEAGRPNAFDMARLREQFKS